MCGIVGYVGGRAAIDILIGGLKRLEYRGYDSAGVALVGGGAPTVYPVQDTITVPRSPALTAPIPTTVALQLFAYHVARLRGCPIDQPRNLAKSVTVE
jgi:glucosamine--fructose-6-phosphate aminotransferase (isomerizing)